MLIFLALVHRFIFHKYSGFSDARINTRTHTSRQEVLLDTTSVGFGEYINVDPATASPPPAR